MKRIIAAMALLIGACLVPLAIQAMSSSASALDCSNRVTNSRNQVWDPPHAGAVAVTKYISYRYCLTSAGDAVSQVSSYIVELDTLSGGCGDIRQWTINPDGLGTPQVNKPPQTRACENGPVQYTFSYGLPGVNVWANSYGQERCIASVATADMISHDDRQYSASDICFYQ